MFKKVIVKSTSEPEKKQDAFVKYYIDVEENNEKVYDARWNI